MFPVTGPLDAKPVVRYMIMIGGVGQLSRIDGAVKACPFLTPVLLTVSAIYVFGQSVSAKTSPLGFAVLFSGLKCNT